MADTPETKAKKAIKKLLADLSAALGVDYALMPNAAGGIGFANGRADSTLYWRRDPLKAPIPIELEVKAKDNYPTAKQRLMLESATKAGAHGLVIWGDRPQDLDWLRSFLTTVSHDTEPTLKLGKTR